MSALAVSGSEIFVGGDFSSIGGQSRSRIAKLSGTGTGAADPIWNPGANGTWLALARIGKRRFRRRLLLHQRPVSAVRAATGSRSCRARAPVPSTRAGTLTRQQVQALAVSGSTLVVGGSVQAHGLARDAGVALLDAIDVDPVAVDDTKTVTEERTPPR